MLPLLMSCLFVFTICPCSSVIHCVKSMWEEPASLQFFSPSRLDPWAYFTCSFFHPFMHASNWWPSGARGSPEQARKEDEILNTREDEEEDEESFITRANIFFKKYTGKFSLFIASICKLWTHTRGTHWPGLKLLIRGTNRQPSAPKMLLFGFQIVSLSS